MKKLIIVLVLTLLISSPVFAGSYGGGFSGGSSYSSSSSFSSSSYGGGFRSTPNYSSGSYAPSSSSTYRSSSSPTYSSGSYKSSRSTYVATPQFTTEQRNVARVYTQTQRLQSHSNYVSAHPGGYYWNPFSRNWFIWWWIFGTHQNNVKCPEGQKLIKNECVKQ